MLICKEGTDLPFDIRLSRVIFYRFNGTDIDWEIVEEIVPQLRNALLTAKEQKPDSSVHALLEKVYPEDQSKNIDSSYLEKGVESETEKNDNREFEKIVAKQWMTKKAQLKDY